MKNIGVKILRLFTGFVLCAFGITFMINANLGLSPWDVLHQGLSNNLGITIGSASIGVGLIVVILDVILGENVGWGTVTNMIFIGLFLDIILFIGIVPVSTNVFSGIIMLIIGMSLMAIGMVLYLGCGLGSGPRDGMMIAIQKRTNKSVKFIRGTMEVGVLIVGYFLGGTVGIGTIITAFGLGYILQIVFNMFNFESHGIVHRSIVDDINYLKSQNNKDTYDKKSL